MRRLHLAVLFIFVSAFVEFRFPFVPNFLCFVPLCLCESVCSIYVCSVWSRDVWIKGCMVLKKGYYLCFDPNEIFLTFFRFKHWINLPFFDCFSNSESISPVSKNWIWIKNAIWLNSMIFNQKKLLRWHIVSKHEL